ncbi:methylenetetrahydrofolate reductase C-terminal domain-containing protein [Herbiconiux sp. YIM B11900]|uniref:methylenetetrahydrofolate reductase n=1 Tax=Herbiconiux sp. YIM B11900 TaxID=3404131 RepID=UPI003F83A3DC
MSTSAAFVCPKAMDYGPCGGVHPDGTCEVAPHPCVFLDSAPRPWSGIDRPGQRSLMPLPAPRRQEGTDLLALMRSRPIVMSDFPIRDPSRPTVEAGARALVGWVDAVLIGEPPSVRVQYPPAFRTQMLRSLGLTVWCSVNCRDRNRVALEGELAALADAGVSAVHCVTGDHPALGRRPDAMPVFDLDSTELTSLARARGLTISVAESPESEPVAIRPQRFAQKYAAGADIAFLNINSGPTIVRDFLAEAGRLGAPAPAVVCVPLMIDEGSAAIMTGLPSHLLPPGYLERIMGSEDRREAGIAAAVDLALRYLEVDGVRGVCMSGGATRGGEVDYAAAMAEAASRLSVG